MAELQPGLHQIEQVLGPRYLFQYLLTGQRTMLIDTGIATSPDEVILPYFRQIGFEPARLDYILISHADADHMGGNARMQHVAPQAIFACHHLDAPWIGSRERIIAERYGWYRQFNMDYPPEVADWLDQSIGPDVRIDLHLTGDEIFYLAENRPVRVLHLPGHSDGHIGLYDEANKAAIIIDAILWQGLLDMENVVISPPPYSTIQAYLDAIDVVLDLDFDHLYTGHYENKSGTEARRFLEESKAFVHRCQQTVADVLAQADGPLELVEIHQGVDQLLGPYSAFAIELAKPVYAHLGELVSEGQVAYDDSGSQPTWRAR